jgi:Multicopper oxidase
LNDLHVDCIADAAMNHQLVLNDTSLDAGQRGLDGDRYIGEFVIHCHILDHENSGMMTNVRIVPNKGAPGNGIGMSGMHQMHSMMINNPTPKQ